jgi:microcystin-dependent protein
MKKSITLLLILFTLLVQSNVKAQTTVLSSGMSIQGIARDINNEALANIDQLDLIFTLYYFVGASTTPTVMLTRTAAIKTDNFGVFSYVLVIDQAQYNLISTNSAYLRVSSGSIVFSDEKLQTVPYAIHAQNGVPTGSIMPFIGTDAPNGWLLCNGSAIPAGAYYDNLRSLVGGPNTPDLRAMFLRGVGSQTAFPGRQGPALKTVQQDSVISHLHGVNINTNSNGNHTHTVGFSNDDYNGNGGTNTNGLTRDTNLGDNRTLTTNSTGAHTHTVIGNTANTGGTETRPINYGVNYIIKI